MMRRPASLRRKPQPKAERFPGLKESHIEQAVTQFLELDGWRAFKMEKTVEFRTGADGKQHFKRKVGEKGMPDHLYLRYSPGPFGWTNVLWIEFKKLGESPRQDQSDWHGAERKRGALVLVVDDIDEFREWYRQSGLQLRS